MQLSRSKIDRIGERIRSGGLDAKSLVELSHYRNGFASAYKAVEHTVRDALGLEVSGRPAKSTTAIIDKLQRESIRLSQMQDIAGCRVIVSGMYTQDRLVANLAILLENARIIDRRDDPSHGYRAVHVVTVTQYRPVEVQVRTRLQHTWADLSEKLADSYGQEIKYGKGNAQVVAVLDDLSREIERLEKIRLDRNLIREGLPLRYRSVNSQTSLKRTEKDLARLDRESLYRIRAILNREVDA